MFKPKAPISLVFPGTAIRASVRPPKETLIAIGVWITIAGRGFALSGTYLIISCKSQSKSSWDCMTLSMGNEG